MWLVYTCNHGIFLGPGREMNIICVQITRETVRNGFNRVFKLRVLYQKRRSMTCLTLINPSVGSSNLFKSVCKFCYIVLHLIFHLITIQYNKLNDQTNGSILL